MSMVVLINFFSAISSANRMANFSRSFSAGHKGHKEQPQINYLKRLFFVPLCICGERPPGLGCIFSYTFLLFSPFGAILETKPVCYAAAVIGDTFARRWRCNNLVCWCGIRKVGAMQPT